MGEHFTGENNPFYRGKFSDDTLRKIIKNLHAGPYQSEEELIEIIEEHSFPFQYVGNGDLIIDGKNPDFVHTGGEKKVIELFGVYWHSPVYGRVRPTITYDAIKNHYAENGYESLIIWDTELVNESKVEEKIMNFMEVR